MKYQKSVVTYFDILGFRELIVNRDPDQVSQILSTFTYVGRHLQMVAFVPEKMDLNAIPTMESVAFSDLIVRTTRIPELTQVGDYLLSEAYSVARIIRSVTFHKILVRGAITIGDIVLQDRAVFGPGLIRAYDLESKLASNPRVILDPLVASDLFDGSAGQTNLASQLNRIFERDEDGLRFVDYAAVCILEDYDRRELESIVPHRQLITEGLDEYRGKPSILKKFEWLKAYHNRAVMRTDDNFFRKLGIQRDDLLVP
jgi:hypothetical protein